MVHKWAVSVAVAVAVVEVVASVVVVVVVVVGVGVVLETEDPSWLASRDGWCVMVVCVCVCGRNGEREKRRREAEGRDFFGSGFFSFSTTFIPLLEPLFSSTFEANQLTVVVVGCVLVLVLVFVYLVYRRENHHSQKSETNKKNTQLCVCGFWM